MKVHKLIALLEDCDPNADVFVMCQPNYPFECRIDGLAIRGEWTRAEEDEEEDGEGARVAPSPGEGELPATDVFLLEGAQLRYGSKRAWDSAR